jgi:hypothetical protein
VAYEDPYALLARLRLGREELCQRLLTALILGGPYPRWNTRNRPSGRGEAFLRRLDELCFGEPRWRVDPTFVDELELPARTEEERGGAPDQAVLWPDRVWLIELKTEAASHRRDQLPAYFTLAAHHHRGAQIDITYITPDMKVAAPSVVKPNRYAHVTWSRTAELVATIWSDSNDAAESKACRVLLETLDQLALPPARWRAGLGITQPARAQSLDVTDQGQYDDVVGRALDLARRTAEDGRHRAVDVTAHSLEALQALRLAIRDAIRTEPANAPVRHVLPWLWNAERSGGRPMTASGSATGYELRLSRYARALD